MGAGAVECHFCVLCNQWGVRVKGVRKVQGSGVSTASGIGITTAVFQCLPIAYMTKYIQWSPLMNGYRARDIELISALCVYFSN